ncbi:type IX secretion system membrane protein PorP/SprF [Pedobacter hiemivivus]|uniref:Type IX secretion system membrane protein PorP/SprF n=1 Tax=Pedobacter hiemivivus TaxID=2530454 RepID=A0A4U1GLF7_9SPHI|nr:type IX secretion system membrane protein PorP/SprF [Pedobacter hiemivivus]TKC65225.1 type IX secretion system membrane protein PorP/SprF [Pedobacter hiemivivus]
MKRTFVISVLMLAGLAGKAQQDAQFSQYMFNGIYINPAYAGYKEELNVHSFYRSQWTGIKRAPVTMSVAVDAIANNRKVGLALQIANDRVGAQSTLSGYVNYAYRIKMSGDESSRLAFGIGAGLMQLGLDGSLLEPGEVDDAYIPAGMQSTVLPDARAGVYYSNNRVYAGFSVDNLVARYFDTNEGRNLLVPVPRPHYYLTAGALIPLSQDVQLKPSFLLKDDRGGPTNLDVNAFMLLNERLWLGVSYRTSVSLYSKDYLNKSLQKTNSMVGLVEVFASERWRIGYAYDYSLSSLRTYSGGSHEISLGFYLKSRNVRMTSPRYF